MHTLKGIMFSFTIKIVRYIKGNKALFLLHSKCTYSIIDLRSTKKEDYFIYMEIKNIPLSIILDHIRNIIKGFITTILVDAQSYHPHYENLSIFNEMSYATKKRNI